MQLVSLSQCSFTILKTLETLSYAQSTLYVLYKWNDKAWMIAQLFTMWFTDYLSPIGEPYCSEKKKRDSFQNITARRQCPWAPKSSDEDVECD